jgi:hypothetical protein
VTEGRPNEGWEDWLAAPPADDPDAERFKWGWNNADGEVVWPVSGPGDGWPAHAEQLETAWGRKLQAGDVLGSAEYVPVRGSDPAVVAIHVYYGGRVPGGVTDWFKTAFPDAQVRLAGAQ